MIKYFRLLVKSALLVSCNPATSGAIDDNGYQYISGYFLKEDIPKLCILRFHLEPASKRDIYRIINKHLPKFTIESEYNVIGIGYGEDSFIDLSSSEFCQYARAANPDVKFFSGVGRDVAYHGEFKKVEIDRILKQYGMDSIATQDPRMRSSKCVQELEVDYFLDGAQIYELRFRYAIPIFAHSLSRSGSNTESLFLFEGQCEKSKEFMSDIVDLGFPRKK
jgi:hypothetical protein